ncbi:MAG: 2-oxoglutarate dehydrogenase E1 component, partial [Rhodospirillales bacterium]|nr:2-oxoglutarate dehydrogenase E1 component [Rhodospirillales bacterium]
MASPIDSFLAGSNATYVAELYARFLENPTLVDQTWVDFFSELADDLSDTRGDLSGASWAPSESAVIGTNGGVYAEEIAASLDHTPVSQDGGSTAEMMGGGLPTMARGLDGRAEAGKVRQATLDSISALMMIRVYRVRGHLNANFDPLGLEGKDLHTELDPKTYGFHEEDMDRPIFINNVLG